MQRKRQLCEVSGRGNLILISWYERERNVESNGGLAARGDSTSQRYIQEGTSDFLTGDGSQSPLHGKLPSPVLFDHLLPPTAALSTSFRTKSPHSFGHLPLGSLVPSCLHRTPHEYPPSIQVLPKFHQDSCVPSFHLILTGSKASSLVFFFLIQRFPR
jgi:hypothetical protein